MLHVDDGQLHAYLDGELAALDAEEARQIERHLAVCSECQARLAEERDLRERAHVFLGGSGPAELAEPSFQTLAARRSSAGAEPPREPRRWRPAHALAWAASLVLALGAGWFGRELLRQPAEMRVAAESAAVADRPAPAAADAQGAAPPEPQMLADAALSTGEAPAEPAPPSLAARSARPRTATPPPPSEAAVPTADAEMAVTESSRAPAPTGEGIVYGRVTNETGVGIPHVPVSIRALNTGTLTRADGSYSLIVPAAHLAAAEDLAITATYVGMHTDSQRLVLRPGQEVAANFELRSQSFALEELLVTAQPQEAGLNRSVDVASAPPAAARGDVRWEPVDRAEAERRLGGRLRLVPGLQVVAITAAEAEGQPVIRTMQRLDGGEWLELLQRRELPARESTFVARARAEAAAAAPVPSIAAAEPAPGDGLATLAIRRDGYRITARAPLSADSLRTLLSRVH